MPTFGYTSIGGSIGGDALSADIIVGCKFSLVETAIISKLTAYLKTNGSNNFTVNGLIYSDNAGAPGSIVGNIASGPLITSSTPDWYDTSFETPLTLVAGTYWLTLITNNTWGGYAYDAGTTNQLADKGSGIYFDSAPTPFPTPHTDDLDRQMSIYATYTQLSPKALAVRRVF